jgi:hypothetical protein
MVPRLDLPSHIRQFCGAILNGTGAIPILVVKIAIVRLQLFESRLLFCLVITVSAADQAETVKKRCGWIQWGMIVGRFHAKAGYRFSRQTQEAVRRSSNSSDAGSVALAIGMMENSVTALMV